jgi:hypothetical protein
MILLDDSSENLSTMLHPRTLLNNSIFKEKCILFHHTSKKGRKLKEKVVDYTMLLPLHKRLVYSRLIFYLYTRAFSLFQIGFRFLPCSISYPMKSTETRTGDFEYFGIVIVQNHNVEGLRSFEHCTCPCVCRVQGKENWFPVLIEHFKLATLIDVL